MRLDYNVSLAAAPGEHLLTFTFSDPEERSSTAVANMTVLPSVVISQIYTPGGGGSGSAHFEHSFIELHNRGATTVALDG